VADDRDDLAIARVAHAFDHMLGLVDRLRGRLCDGQEHDQDRG
jgi:hypothetical protein